MRRESVEVNWKQRICIYDTFGFFQQKFTLALSGFPNALTPDEYKIVEDNKAKRGKFTAGDIEEIKLYTSLELKGLVNMMNTIRTSLREAIPGKPIEIDEWYGAGAIARASLKIFLGDDAKEHLGVSSRPSQSAGSSGASFGPSPTCKPQSTAFSKSTISNRSPSPGPPIQTKSSPPSGAGTKR